MELRNVVILFALVVLAVSQCTEARHSMHRRETDYDLFAADEASDDENTQNDEYETERPEVKNQPPGIQANITTMPQVYEVIAGTDVILECDVDPDNGTIAQWYKDGNLYFFNTMKTYFDRDLTRYSIVNKTKHLEIKAVEADDAGVYKCEVVQNSPVSVDHTVVMLTAPEIVRFTATNDGRVPEGSDLLLTCDVIGKPPPQIVWSRAVDNGNQRLGEQDGEFTQNSVYMKGVKMEHAGKYYCYAFNSVGHNQAELDVSIAGKPRVHVHKTVVNSAVNVHAVLQCSTRYEDNPFIRWYKDGKLIADTAEYIITTLGPQSNLTLTPDANDDFGTYTCEAENRIGKHNRSIELVQRPVVEALGAVGGKLEWTVHSHQPLQEIEAQLRTLDGDEDWKAINIPLPSASSHRYELTYDLNDKVDPGQYQAFIKVRNDHSWSDNVDPVVIEIEVQPSMSIQHASVFRGSGNSNSIRPPSVILSTILMYLLVRTL